MITAKIVCLLFIGVFVFSILFSCGYIIYSIKKYPHLQSGLENTDIPISSGIDEIKIICM